MNRRQFLGLSATSALFAGLTGSACGAGTHAAFDLDAVRRYRRAWGIFRDRRPDLYYPILSLDGRG